MRYSPKNHKIEQIGGWLAKAQASPAGYRLTDADFKSITKGMNLKQVQFVLTLVCATYSAAHDESRKSWSPKFHAMREAAERATGNKEISYSGLRLVASNE